SRPTSATRPPASPGRPAPPTSRPPWGATHPLPDSPETIPAPRRRTQGTDSRTGEETTRDDEEVEGRGPALRDGDGGVRIRARPRVAARARARPDRGSRHHEGHARDARRGCIHHGGGHHCTATCRYVG